MPTASDDGLVSPRHPQLEVTVVPTESFDRMMMLRYRSSASQ